MIINEHDVINEHARKKFFRINDHAGKSATILELNSKLNKQTWSFIRYFRVHFMQWKTEGLEKWHFLSFQAKMIF